MSTDDASFHVDFATGHRYNLGEIRDRREAFMPDGGHSWVISALYGVDDPEVAMDALELGPDNFVGVTDIHCLLCAVEYATSIRHHKCPQQLRAGKGTP